MNTLRATALVVACYALVLAQQGVTAVDYAMQLPGAERSLLLDIAAAGQRLVAVGERGHILISEDRGGSWRQVQVPTTAMLTRVFFIDDRTGWAVGHDGNVLHSVDGGLTWSLQRDGVAEQAGINERRAGRAQRRVAELEALVTAAGDGDIASLEVELEEALWALDRAREVMDEPLYAPPLMDIWFASPERGWASGAYGTLLFTANGGRHWADWSHTLDNPDELHLNGVVGDGRGTLYLASEWGAVFVSGNGGEDWRSAQTGYDGSFFGVLASPATGTVFAYGLLGTIYRSTDQGESWEPVDSGVGASLFGAEQAGDAVIFVGQGGTATVSRDDGSSFQALVQPSREGLFGVAYLDGAGFFATGEGGSRSLVSAPPGDAP